jgi:AAHS family 4-hydroxybenzoate transporter-like MFS transporter
MTALTIDQLVDTRRFGSFHLRILVLCLLMQFVDGFDMRSISLVAPQLVKHWHVPREAFGPVFGAAATGVMLATLVAGPLGDRVGRKLLMTASLLIAAVLMAATAFVHSIPALIALRFLCGLPLGALVPMTVVLASEWSPARHRAVMVLTMCGGYSLGSVLSPLMVSGLSHAFGWRAVFYAGGGASVLLAALVAALLPESLRFLGLRNTPERKARIAQILQRFAPDAAIAEAAMWPSPERTGGWRAVPALFRDHRARVTLLAWSCLFLAMIAETFLVSWLPTLLGDVVSADHALWLTSLFPLGGIAATLLLGSASDRFGPWRMLALLFALSVPVIALIGFAGSMLPALIAAVALAGFCVIGGHHLMTVQAATLYPTTMRATGTSWVVAIGRAGSILGPVIGGALIGRHLPAQVMFPAMAVFAAAACGVALLLGAASRNQPATDA